MSWAPVRQKVLKRNPNRNSHHFADLVIQAAADRGILAHDINKGLPCFVCGDVCPGFELHFWRKHCVHCKCTAQCHQSLFTEDGDEEDLSKRPVSMIGGKGIVAASSFKKKSARKVGKLPKHLLTFLEKESTKYKPTNVPEKNMGQLSRVKVDYAKTIPEDGEEEEVVVEFTWQPPTLTTEQAVAFYQAPYPVELIPVKGSEGESNFLIEADKQQPRHDISPEACDGLNQDDKEEFMALVELREESKKVGSAVAMEHEATCPCCSVKLHADDIAVCMPTKVTVGEDGTKEVEEMTYFHPACFKCCVCSQVLAGLNCFERDGKYYCGRHFNDTIKARCAACDESIMEEEYVQADGRAYHKKHFCCIECDTSLLETRYVLFDEEPHCVPCFNKAEQKRLEKAESAKDGSDSAVGASPSVGGGSSTKSRGTSFKKKEGAGGAREYERVSAAGAAQGGVVPPGEAPPTRPKKKGSVKAPSEAPPLSRRASQKGNNASSPPKIVEPPQENLYEPLWPEDDKHRPRVATQVPSTFNSRHDVKRGSTKRAGPPPMEPIPERRNSQAPE